MSLSQSLSQLVRALQGKAGEKWLQTTLDLEASSHPETEQIPKEENSVKSTTRRRNLSGKAARSEDLTFSEIKAFIHEGSVYVRCIPVKTLFHSTTIHEVVNRGSFFAIDLRTNLLTVLPAGADKLRITIPVPQQVKVRG